MRTCGNCRQPGHNRQTCPSLGRDKGSSSKEKSSYSYRRKSRCGECGSTDHTLPKCPRRKYINDERAQANEKKLRLMREVIAQEGIKLGHLVEVLLHDVDGKPVQVPGILTAFQLVYNRRLRDKDVPTSQFNLKVQKFGTNELWNVSNWIRFGKEDVSIYSLPDRIHNVFVRKWNETLSDGQPQFHEVSNSRSNGITLLPMDDECPNIELTEVHPA